MLFRSHTRTRTRTRTHTHTHTRHPPDKNQRTEGGYLPKLMKHMLNIYYSILLPNVKVELLCRMTILILKKLVLGETSVKDTLQPDSVKQVRDWTNPRLQDGMAALQGGRTQEGRARSAGRGRGSSPASSPQAVTCGRQTGTPLCLLSTRV